MLRMLAVVAVVVGDWAMLLRLLMLLLRLLLLLPQQLLVAPFRIVAMDQLDGVQADVAVAFVQVGDAKALLLLLL